MPDSVERLTVRSSVWTYHNEFVALQNYKKEIKPTNLL